MCSILKTKLIAYHVQLLKLGTSQGLREVFSLKEGLNLNAGLVLGRQAPLGLLDLTTKLLHSAVVFAHIFASLLLIQLDEVLHDTLVKVLASQVSVTVGGHHFKHTIVNGQERDIKSAAAQIEHKNVLLAVLLVQAISNGSSSSREFNKRILLKRKKGNIFTNSKIYIILIGCLRFIDNSHNIQTSNGTSILSGLALSIIEVGGDSDHSMCDLRKTAS